MPIYEYYCYGCRLGRERISSIDRRNDTLRCDSCNNPMELCISVPAVQVWDTSRSFPNLTGYGDGSMTFDSKNAYQSHLDRNGVGELSTSAPKINKPCVKWKKVYG
jgi:putative FmdB family regulatory protein